MAYEVRIRGHKEPIIVEKNAERLKSDWQNFIETKKDQVVEIEGWTGRLSLIQDFQRAKTIESNKTQSDSDEEYFTERKKILSLSLEERASQMGWFRLIYFGFTKQYSENVVLPNGRNIEDYAKDIQMNFFEKNPKRTMCDITEFKPLIKSDKCNEKIISTLEQNIRQDKYAEAHF